MNVARGLVGVTISFLRLTSCIVLLLWYELPELQLAEFTGERIHWVELLDTEIDILQATSGSEDRSTSQNQMR